MAATFSIQIQANPSGASSAARQVESDLARVKDKALEINATLRSIFGFYALKELVEGAYDLVDGFQALQNKLRVTTTDQANLNGMMNQTYKIANDTRSSWDATVQTYQRLELNSRTLGASQKDLLGFTDELNKAIIVGGATTREARNGMLQLAQGMAAGRLQGQDLRAVMEDLPVVADVIAAHFHKIGRAHV